MAEKWEEIRNALIDSIESRSRDFLNQNVPAALFLKERAERLAKLMVSYATLSGAEREQVKSDMEIVRATIETEAAALAVSASSGAKKLFATLVGVAFDALVKTLPGIVAAL